MPTEAVLSRQEHVDHAQLRSYVLEDGRVFHHFSFYTANWSGKDIAIILPDASARVLAAKVVGLWQDNIPMRTVDKGLEIRLPVPLSPERKGEARSLQDLVLGNHHGRIDLSALGIRFPGRLVELGRLLRSLADPACNAPPS